jgi:hypothetical protein
MMGLFTLPGFLLVSGMALALLGLLGAGSRIRVGPVTLESLSAGIARLLVLWGVTQMAIAGYLFLASAMDEPPPTAAPTPNPTPTATAIVRASATPIAATEAPPTSEPSDTPEPPSTPTVQAPTSPPPTQPVSTDVPARSIQFTHDGPPLGPDTSCTGISWVTQGYLRVHVFLEGTDEGDAREAVGGMDLCPGKDKPEEVHILRAYYSETEFDESRVVVPIQ